MTIEDCDTRFEIQDGMCASASPRHAHRASRRHLCCAPPSPARTALPRLPSLSRLARVLLRRYGEAREVSATDISAALRDDEIRTALRNAGSVTARSPDAHLPELRKPVAARPPLPRCQLEHGSPPAAATLQKKR